MTWLVRTLEAHTQACENAETDGTCARWAPGGRRLASGSDDHKLRVYYGLADAVAPSLKYTLDDAIDWVHSVAFSAESKLLPFL